MKRLIALVVSLVFLLAVPASAGLKPEMRIKKKVTESTTVYPSNRGLDYEVYTSGVTLTIAEFTEMSTADVIMNVKNFSTGRIWVKLDSSTNWFTGLTSGGGTLYNSSGDHGDWVAISFGGVTGFINSKIGTWTVE